MGKTPLFDIQNRLRDAARSCQVIGYPAQMCHIKLTIGKTKLRHCDLFNNTCYQAQIFFQEIQYIPFQKWLSCLFKMSMCIPAYLTDMK